MRDSKLHAGHRQRMRAKIKEFGLNSLNDHEALEAFLYNAVPFKDTNELAHKLLETYGSFYNVCNSCPSDLLKFNGLGESAVDYITIFPQFVSFYLKSASQKPSIQTPKQAVDYFRQNFKIGKFERSYMCALDRENYLISFSQLSEGDGLKTKLNPIDVLNRLGIDKPKRIMFLHTHPFGDVKPSFEDIDATNQIIKICNTLKIDFVDHIIINETEWFSFRNERIIDDLGVEIGTKAKNKK